MPSRPRPRRRELPPPRGPASSARALLPAVRAPRRSPRAPRPELAVPWTLPEAREAPAPARSPLPAPPRPPRSSRAVAGPWGPPRRIGRPRPPLPPPPAPLEPGHLPVVGKGRRWTKRSIDPIPDVKQAMGEALHPLTLYGGRFEYARKLRREFGAANLRRWKRGAVADGATMARIARVLHADPVVFAALWVEWARNRDIYRSEGSR